MRRCSIKRLNKPRRSGLGCMFWKIKGRAWNSEEQLRFVADRKAFCATTISAPAWHADVELFVSEIANTLAISRD